MGKVTGLLRVLSREEMDRIHNAALRVLEETGMWIDAAGRARVFQEGRLRGRRRDEDGAFPEAGRGVGGLEDARAVRGYVAGRALGERADTAAYSSPTSRNVIHNRFTANTGGFPPFILDLDGRRRKATMKDVTDAIRLADALDNIDMMGVPCSAQEIPHEERPIRMTAELLKRTKKLGGIETWNKRDVHAVAEMCDVVSGSRDESVKRPRIMGYAETRSPLCLDANMSDIFIEYAKMGFPQSMDCMPCGGTTAPASSAGTITVGLAETLGCAVLGYAVSDPESE